MSESRKKNGETVFDSVRVKRHGNMRAVNSPALDPGWIGRKSRGGCCGAIWSMIRTLVGIKISVPSWVREVLEGHWLVKLRE